MDAERGEVAVPVAVADAAPAHHSQLAAAQVQRATTLPGQTHGEDVLAIDRPKIYEKLFGFVHYYKENNLFEKILNVMKIYSTLSTIF